MERYFFRDTIQGFIKENPQVILGELTKNNPFSLISTQRDAWIYQIQILKEALQNFEGELFFEYTIPTAVQNKLK